jgi:hypothetical protein
MRKFVRPLGVCNAVAPSVADPLALVPPTAIVRFWTGAKSFSWLPG